MNIKFELPPVLPAGTLVGCDTEFMGQKKEKLHRPHGVFGCLTLAVGEDVYIVKDVTDLVEAFRRIKDATQVWQNALYDVRQLSRFVCLDQVLLYDTMLIEQGLWGGYYNHFGLDDLARRYLNIRLDKSIRKGFEDIHPMTMDEYEYAALDAYITLKVFEEQQKVKHWPIYKDVYMNIDGPMIWVVFDMQPVKIDVDHMLPMVEEFERRGRAIEEELGINVKSPKVKEYLNSHLGCNLSKADKETLENLHDPLSDRILEARLYRDAYSKYGAKWIEKNVEDGNFVFANFKIIGAETGRMACDSPNLQNIPARKIPEYRELFISMYGDDGEYLVTDIQAQEPRILCWHSKDKELRRIFEDGLDIHLEVARAATGDYEMEKSDPRRSVIGKKINLATSYGMTTIGLAVATGKTEQEAQDFLDKYFKRFSGVKNYIDSQRSFAARMGYVETASGRRVWINPYDSQWDKNAINAPIQGGASDFTKRWVVLFHERTIKENLKFPLSNIVHDELDNDCLKICTAAYRDMLDDTFQQTANEIYPGVPFKTEYATGPNWGCKG